MPGRTAYPDRQTPSLHDALPISYSKGGGMSRWTAKGRRITGRGWAVIFAAVVAACTDTVAPPSLRPPSFSLSPNGTDRKSTLLNSSHLGSSYAVFSLNNKPTPPP